MDFTKTFKLILDFFLKEGMEFALAGGFALNVYGMTRTTNDIDILLEENSSSKVIPFLESLGYQTLYKSVAFSNHEHPLGLARIDFIYVSGETAQKMFSESRQFPLFSSQMVKVVKPEHLIALKLFSIANNPDRAGLDTEDIRHLLGQPDLDFEEVSGYFKKFSSLKVLEELRKINDQFKEGF
jgi:hypothetical protein